MAADIPEEKKRSFIDSLGHLFEHMKTVSQLDKSVTTFAAEFSAIAKMNIPPSVKFDMFMSLANFHDDFIDILVEFKEHGAAREKREEAFREGERARKEAAESNGEPPVKKQKTEEETEAN